MSLAMCAAIVSDIATFRIPNILPITAAAAFIPAVIAQDWLVSAMLWNVSAGVTVLLVCFALFMRGIIGGGDAKLLAAGALWTGWNALYAYIFFVAVIGGVFAVVILIYRRIPLPIVFARVGWLARLHSDPTHVPYGVAIGSGMIVCLSRAPLTNAILQDIGIF